MTLFNSPAARQALIMDRYLKPRSRGALSASSFQGRAKARNCADTVVVGLTFSDEKLSRASFEGSGCAIFTASTDLLLEALQNKTRTEIADYLSQYELMLSSGEISEALGELNVFSNVKRHLNRLDCALVGVRAVREALA